MTADGSALVAALKAGACELLDCGAVAHEGGAHTERDSCTAQAYELNEHARLCQEYRQAVAAAPSFIERHTDGRILRAQMLLLAHVLGKTPTLTEEHDHA